MALDVPIPAATRSLGTAAVAGLLQQVSSLGFGDPVDGGRCGFIRAVGSLAPELEEGFRAAQ